MNYAIQFTAQSRNVKVGPMPVSTTSANTCPDACPLKANGCYADAGPLAILWRALSKVKAPGHSFTSGRNKIKSLTWEKFCKTIAALPEGTLWRHNQAGDLPGENNTIDRRALALLVNANRSKRGFTYTHKPLTKNNLQAIKNANANGFTINLSADNLQEADTLAATGLPTVVVLSSEIHGNVKITTPNNRKVAVCPATYIDAVSCATCQLCQRQDRKVIIGFPAHGASKRKASAIATQGV